MAEKNASKSVMGNLPSTRPARIGGRRESGDGEPAKARSNAAAAKPKAKPAAAKAKPAAAKSEPVAAKRKPAAAKARPTAAKPKPVAAQTASPKPRAVRSGSPALKASKDKQRPRRPAPSSPPKGTEIVTTAVQAAGELAQIGLTLGGQAVKRAVKRFPKR